MHCWAKKWFLQSRINSYKKKQTNIPRTQIGSLVGRSPHSRDQQAAEEFAVQLVSRPGVKVSRVKPGQNRIKLPICEHPTIHCNESNSVISTKLKKGFLKQQIHTFA
jgi:hypothetical protein